MKKRMVLFTIIIMTGAMVIYAQKDDKEGQKVGGIRAGWHTATLVEDGSKADTINNLNGFYVGFFRDTKIVPLLNFGSGLEYFQNGTAYTNNSERVLHTISIPLDLKVKLGPVFALGGIAANFKVSEKIKIDGESISPMSDDKSAWFDTPVFLGAGVKIAFLTVEARYHWGLLEVRNGKKSQYFQLGAAFSF